MHDYDNTTVSLRMPKSQVEALRYYARAQSDAGLGSITPSDLIRQAVQEKWPIIDPEKIKDRMISGSGFIHG